MTTDEIQALILKIQHLDRIRPRAVELIAQLVDQFLDGSEPPLDEDQPDETGGTANAGRP